MAVIPEFISSSLLGRFVSRVTGNDRFVRAPGCTINQIFTPGQPQWDRIQDNEAEIYQTTGPLQTVINKKAMMKSAGIWRHFEVKPDGTTEDLGATPIIERLNNPNPLQSKDDFLKQFSIHRDVHGAAFQYALLGSALEEAPLAIWNILPQEISIKTSGLIYEQTDITKIIQGFIYGEHTTAQKIYKADEILYRRLDNIDHPIFPASPLLGLTMEISNIRGAMGFRNVIIRKKGALGIISNDAADAEGTIPLSMIERERIEKEYQRSFGIADDQMQIIIANASLSWQPMTFPTKEMELFREVTEDVKVVIDRYGLNVNIFSIDNGTSLSDSGSRILEGERLAYQDTIIPESNDDTQALSDYLGLTEEGEFLLLDYSHLPALKDDEVKKSQIVERKARAFAILVGVEGFSPEDALQMVGLRLDDLP